MSLSSPDQNILKPRAIGMVNWVGLATLIKREVDRFTTVYLQTIFAPMVTTLLYYTIFALAFGGIAREVNGAPFLEFLAPGLIMMSMVQNAFANTSSSIVISKVQGSIVDMLMPPLSDVELMIGYVTGGLVRGLIVGLTTGGAVMLFVDLPVHSWVLIIGYAVLGNFMLSALGVITGIWADKFDNMAAITNFIITPMTFLSGTFYSVQSLPEMWHAVALYNPFFYMIDGFRSGFTGTADGSIFVGVSVLLSINIVLILCILLMLRSGYKMKS